MRVDQLDVIRHPDRAALGRAAGREIADILRQALAAQRRVRVVFAAAPSQNETLAALASAEGIEWSRVEAFHMDEYVGLEEGAPQRFARYLEERIFRRVMPGAVHLIGTGGSSSVLAAAADECRRYADVLGTAVIDLVCLGIGENGHIAFNDPPVADFHDPEAVKVVALDEACRRQQVNDGCFPSCEAVPTHAITLTIPTLLSARRMVCAVPGSTKRIAVERVLSGPVSTSCPASILRTHPACTLHVDHDSAPPSRAP
ncbi:MAG: glucosamine-6-phosphate deaminase [Planctomycetaceae bacterium]